MTQTLDALIAERDRAITQVINMKPTAEELANRHTYHPPRDGVAQKYETIRSTAHVFAGLINELCPDSRELNIAHSKIEEAVFWANAAIARGEK